MRFRLAGIPVWVQPAFFLTAVILGADLLQVPRLLLMWVAVVFGSVLLHELGHAFAFRSLGHASTITLYFMGGHTTARGARLSPGQDVYVSLAGPAAGLLLGGLVWGAGRLEVWPAGATAAVAGRMLLWANVGWGVLNLLPILPMDGGRVLAALLRMRDPDTAERRALAISMVLALLGLVAALRLGDSWIAILCAMFAFGSYQGLQRAPRGGPEAPLRRELDAGFAQLQQGDHEGARAAAESVAGRASDGELRRDAVRLEAWARLVGGDAAGALERVEAEPGLADADPLLTGQALRALGRTSEAVTRLQRAFDASPGPVSGRALVAALGEAGDGAAAARLAESPRAALLDPETLDRIAALLLDTGRPGQALLAAERRFAAGPGPEAAWSAARASQLLGDEAAALRWLRRADEAGLSDPGRIERSPELRPLLDRPELARLRGRL